jgi:hypothetical protein
MLLEGFGIASVDRAQSRYSWDRIGQETVAIYERSRSSGPADEPADGPADEIALTS